MASTINASSTANGIVSTADASGILNVQSNGVNTNAQAWITFKLDTSPTVRASYNISSVTYVSTGIANVNFTNAMIDTNYAVVTTGGIDYTGSYYRQIFREINGTVSTTYFQVRTDPITGLFNGVDYIGCAIFR